MNIVKRVKLEHLIVGTLLAYVTIHLLEEGIFGFPVWAESRWAIPNYTIAKWLLHNIYFIGFLAFGYFIYRNDREKRLPMGLGIIVWGLLNSFNHIIFSIIFMEYSPGLFTGLVFLIFSVLALRIVKEMGKLSVSLMALSVICGLLYWGVPITLFIAVDKALGI